jgi:hypothetical protein
VKNAILDFLSARKIPSSRLSEIDGVGVFWQKTLDWELLTATTDHYLPACCHRDGLIH